MSHLPRYAPPGKFLAEITQRCLLGFFLLLPSKKLNELVAGAFAKAQRMYPVEVVALACMSNHLHLLVTATSQKTISSFMNLATSKIAREAGQLYGWRGKLWARRFDCAPVSDEEAAQIERLKYLLGQGCKEGLVSSPRNWPGLNAARNLITGKGIRGIWFDRTSLFRARRKKENRKVRVIDFKEEVLLELVPLPCWAQLSAEEQRARAQSLVDEIEKETAAMHARRGSSPLGRRAVLQQDPLHRPKTLKRSPAPRFHAATRAAREKFTNALRIFVVAYRTASAKLREGDFGVAFPEGSFPPSRPFVDALQEPRPG